MKRLIAFMVALIFILAGCNQAAGPDRPISAYIGDYVTKVDITHYVGGKSVQWTAENGEVDNLREWASNLKYKVFKYREGQSPGDGDGGEVYEFTLTEGDYSGFSYVINGISDCYLLIEGNWYSVSNPSAPPVTEPQEEKLTLEKVKELAEKGEELSWSDFEQYPHVDIGCGLYIFCYDIDENYYLLIGGGELETPPIYILLTSKADDSISIDIRTEDVAEFINRPTVSVLTQLKDQVGALFIFTINQ